MKPTTSTENCSWTLPQKSRLSNGIVHEFEVVKTQAANGDALAQFELGWMYANGRGAPQDDVQALHWYSKAAQQKNAKAQLKMGWIYSAGLGVTPDAAKARESYRQGVEIYQEQADAGDPLAQLHLGWIYQSGAAVHCDYAIAVTWLKKAAHQGCAQAQFELGSMHRGGYGVSEDLTEAYKWFSLAAEQDLNDAATEREQCKESLVPEQLTEAGQRIELFKTEYTPYAIPFGLPERNFLPAQTQSAL
jgi:TPR repeat protein